MDRATLGTGKPRAGRPEVAKDWAELDRRRATERAAKDEAVRRRNVREAADQKRRGIETQTRRQLASGPATAPATPAAAPQRLPSSPIAGSGLGGLGAAGRAGRIRAVVHDREALRDLLVLREIMDPPVSMRMSPIPADRAFEGCTAVLRRRGVAGTARDNSRSVRFRERSTRDRSGSLYSPPN